MQRKLFSFYIIICLFFLCSCKSKIKNLTTSDDIHFTCTYQITIRTFFIRFPSNPKASIPVIFMLHGYGTKGETFETQTNFTTSANARGYAVVYLDGIPDPDDKTSSTGWNSGIKNSSKDDVGFLDSLCEQLKKNYNFSNFYVVGFSNGAFMTHRLAVQSTKFTAATSVAGFLPVSIWKKRPKKIKTAFLQINGSKDDVVPMLSNGSSKYNKNPSIEQVIEYYKTAYSNPELINYILINGGRHSWPEKKYSGFEVNDIILDFFDSTIE